MKDLVKYPNNVNLKGKQKINFLYNIMLIKLDPFKISYYHRYILLYTRTYTML